ncbi:zinc finger and SCAN domain-containing protein 29-like [Trachinotus anak]|uniref:zinc finger and SCAN domain-containing protein 29-like n=1 Tax=Trachinotus anak TaxID=443729 RepID=UPI0039F1A196
MDVKTKQQWSVEEITCLLAVLSASEIQRKLEGATRTKPVFKQIQREMAAGGYERSIDQIVNKLKKLKKEYRDQKTELGRSVNGRPRFNSPHFEMLDAVLGDRPACNATGALNSATAMLESMQEDTTLEQTSTEPDFTELDVSEELLHSTPQRSSSPTPSSS